MLLEPEDCRAGLRLIAADTFKYPETILESIAHQMDVSVIPIDNFAVHPDLVRFFQGCRPQLRCSCSPGCGSSHLLISLDHHFAPDCHDTNTTLVLQQCDIGERITIDDDKVSQLASLKAADAIIHSQKFRGFACRRRQGFERREAHLNQVNDLVEVVAVVRERHASISAHCKLDSCLVRTLEAFNVPLNGGFGLAYNICSYACCRAVLHHIADSCRGRYQIRTAIEHQFDAFVIEEVTMLHRIDAGLDRVLDCACPVGVRTRGLSSCMGFLDGRAHFVDRELWGAYLRARGKDAAA